MNTYWGDIHSHCAVSYGFGTPKRALDNARPHLDFCSITGHAFWPDMPMDIKTQNEVLITHFGGFEKLKHFWEDLLNDINDADKAGSFVTFPSYEWHSMEYGDYNVYSASGSLPLLDAPTLPELIKRTEKSCPMLLPHHCSYLQGFRGTSWKKFNNKVSPLVEIFSNHGCGESDDSYYDYYHTMGPRVKATSVRSGLLRGNKFGFYASTDTHDGYPGHYGHGRFGVIADKLDRKHIWDGMWNRRTIASTGARFDARFYLNDCFIGETVCSEPEMNLMIELTGTAPLERVELIEGSGDNCKVHGLPTKIISTEFVPGKYKIKIECGWGSKGIIKDWDFDINVKNGNLIDVTPYYRFSSYDMSEEQSSEKLHVEKSRIHWQCRTKPNPAGLIGGTHFAAGGTQAVVLELEATHRTELELQVDNVRMKENVSELIKGSIGQAVSGFCSPAVKIHRAIPEREFRFTYDGLFKPSEEKGFIYARAVQTDGQTAWISPVWYE